MAENGWKWLKMAEKDLKWLEMAGNAWKCLVVSWMRDLKSWIQTFLFSLCIYSVSTLCIFKVLSALPSFAKWLKFTISYATADSSALTKLNWTYFVLDTVWNIKKAWGSQGCSTNSKTAKYSWTKIKTGKKKFALAGCATVCAAWQYVLLDNMHQAEAAQWKNGSWILLCGLGAPPLLPGGSINLMEWGRGV